MADAITKNVGQVWWNAGNAPWKLKREPFRVAPRVYYVGNTWVGAYLIDTGDGLALIDTTVFEDVYQVIESIWELGYDPRNIKNILLTHCHIDHAGGVNQLVSISGAKVWISHEDATFKDHPANTGAGDMFKVVDFQPDCFYSDDAPIVLGDVTIRTRLTPGHTPGTTSFFIEVPDEKEGKLVVGLHGGVGTNTMSNDFLAKFGLDVELRKRFIRDCDAMKNIHVDISIPSHPAHGDLFQRLGSDPMDYTPLVDPAEWARFLEIRKKFAEDLDV